MPFLDSFGWWFMLCNRVGMLPTALPKVVEVKPDGTVQYRQRYTGQLSQPLKLSEFLMDKHKFTIYSVSTAYTADQLEFVPDVALGGQQIIGRGVAHELSLPD